MMQDICLPSAGNYHFLNNMWRILPCRRQNPMLTINTRLTKNGLTGSGKSFFALSRQLTQTGHYLLHFLILQKNCSIGSTDGVRKTKASFPKTCMETRLYCS